MELVATYLPTFISYRIISYHKYRILLYACVRACVRMYVCKNVTQAYGGRGKNPTAD